MDKFTREILRDINALKLKVEKRALARELAEEKSREAKAFYRELFEFIKERKAASRKEIIDYALDRLSAKPSKSRRDTLKYDFYLAQRGLRREAWGKTRSLVKVGRDLYSVVQS